jgi:hypothetical protein
VSVCLCVVRICVFVCVFATSIVCSSPLDVFLVPFLCCLFACTLRPELALISSIGLPPSAAFPVVSVPLSQRRITFLRLSAALVELWSDLTNPVRKNDILPRSLTRSHTHTYAHSHTHTQTHRLTGHTQDQSGTTGLYDNTFEPSDAVSLDSNTGGECDQPEAKARLYDNPATSTAQVNLYDNSITSGPARMPSLSLSDANGRPRPGKQPALYDNPMAAKPAGGAAAIAPTAASVGPASSAYEYASAFALASSPSNGAAQAIIAPPPRDIYAAASAELFASTSFSEPDSTAMLSGPPLVAEPQGPISIVVAEKSGGKRTLTSADKDLRVMVLNFGPGILRYVGAPNKAMPAMAMCGVELEAPHGYSDGSFAVRVCVCVCVCVRVCVHACVRSYICVGVRVSKCMGVN